MTRQMPKSRSRSRAPSQPAETLRTTPKQLGGVTGRGFRPGQSGNPGGRPRSERKLLQSLYGEDGATVYRRLELLRADRKTPTKLKLQIDLFVIERIHGRAPQRVEVEGGSSLVELLVAAAQVAGREV